VKNLPNRASRFRAKQPISGCFSRPKTQFRSVFNIGIFRMGRVRVT
jgi:hypothetical protein